MNYALVCLLDLLEGVESLVFAHALHSLDIIVLQLHVELLLFVV